MHVTPIIYLPLSIYLHSFQMCPFKFQDEHHCSHPNSEKYSYLWTIIWVTWLNLLWDIQVHLRPMIYQIYATAFVYTGSTDSMLGIMVCTTGFTCWKQQNHYRKAPQYSALIIFYAGWVVHWWRSRSLRLRTVSCSSMLPSLTTSYGSMILWTSFANLPFFTIIFMIIPFTGERLPSCCLLKRWLC